MSSEADEKIAAFADELEPKLRKEYADIADWAGKLTGNILRIAGLLCRASVYRSHDFLDDLEPLVVDGQTMDNAIRIGRYFIEHAKAAFSLMGADTAVKQNKHVLSAIQTAKLTEFSRRDIMRLCRSFRKAEELQPVLDHLADYGYIVLNCIIVKDPSRFGREHIMMGMYFEFTFPKKNIRFISVTENEDSAKGLSDFVPIKVLFCEWYAKDTSRKVKTALHAKFAAGQKVCTYAPLGYRKHLEQKNKLIVDEETKWIIEKIFDLASHGAGAAKITKTLIEERVPTAGWLNYTRYGTFANIYADTPEEKAYAWTISQVKYILKDETYIGNSVHGKQMNISYKNKKRIRKPEEEWFRVENTHDAIITKEVFDQIQEQIAHRRRSTKDSVPQIFAGLVRCADCGWSMSFGTNKSNSKPFSYFTCTSYRQFGKTGGTCLAHYIRYDTHVVPRARKGAGHDAGHERLADKRGRAGDGVYP